MIRKARARDETVKVHLPEAKMEKEGAYKGVVAYSSLTGIDVTLHLLRENYLTGDSFTDDLDARVGRVFPIWYEGENDEHPKLQFLVFDPIMPKWYLSCGGMRYCYWCRDFRSQKTYMYDEMDDPFDHVDAEFHDPFKSYGYDYCSDYMY